jgi:hypothetical protein
MVVSLSFIYIVLPLTSSIFNSGSFLVGFVHPQVADHAVMKVKPFQGKRFVVHWSFFIEYQLFKTTNTVGV